MIISDQASSLDPASYGQNYLPTALFTFAHYQNLSCSPKTSQSFVIVMYFGVISSAVLILRCIKRKG